MKTFALMAGLVLAAAMPAHCAWTYTGGNLNATNTYDGLGADSALNPRAQGTSADNDYIGNGANTIGTLIVQSGSLTISNSDFKIGQAGGFGSLFISNNATLNINQVGQWGGGIGQSASATVSSTGIVTVAAGGTFNWFVSGSSEQRFMFGNGNNAGHPGVGILIINGGTMSLNYDPLQTISDNEAQFRVGSDNGLGRVYLNSGAFYDNEPLPFALGGKYTALTTSPVFNQSTNVSTLNISNGVFVMTNLCVQTDPNKATVTVGNTSYINFMVGGTGQLSLRNYQQSDYDSLVAAGSIRVNGSVTSIGSFQFSTSGSQGILKLASVIVSFPTVSPTNTVYAGTAITLNDSPVGATGYRWQTDSGTGGSTWNDLSGATGTNYVLDTTSLSGTYQYQFIATAGALSVTSAPVSLTVYPATAPLVAADTAATPNQGIASVTNYVGGTETFTASFDGTQPMTYRWQFSPNADGSAATYLTTRTNLTLVLTNLQLTNSGYYSLQASNRVSPNTASSTWMQLTVLPAADRFIQWSAPVSFTNLTAGQILNTPAGSYLEAEYFGNSTAAIAVSVGGQLFSFKGDGSSASVAGNAGATTGAFTTNTTGNANFDSVLNMFAYDAPGSGTTHTITLHNLIAGERYAVQIFALDDRNPGRLNNFQDPSDQADISATLDMGDNAYVIGTFTAPASDVAIQQNLIGAKGNINALVVRSLSYVATSPAAILSQPISAAVYVGRNASFTVAVDGLPAPAIQWQGGPVGGPYTNLLNAGRISGVTNTTLIITNVAVSDALELIAVVTNSQNNVTSSAVDLTVLAVPAASGANGTQLLALHPVAYWPLNDIGANPANGGVAAYEVVSAHDGVFGISALDAYNGVVGPQATDGINGFAAGQGALQLDGTTNSMVTTPGLNLNTNTVTITCWVNPNGTQFGFTGLLMNRNVGQMGGLHFRDNNELGYTWVTDNNTQWGHATGLIVPANQWSFCALVVSPTNTTWYLYNPTTGMTNATYTINNPVMPWTGDPSLIRIGSDAATTARVVNGIMDEVAVFNYCLSSNQIAYAAGLSTSFVNTDPATANFHATLSAQSLHFTWASDHQGWQLYTNAVGLSATGSWHPVPGSAGGTSQNITLDPTKTNVFFQLRYP
jgi:hypothetical protein